MKISSKILMINKDYFLNFTLRLLNYYQIFKLFWNNVAEKRNTVKHREHHM